MANRAAAGGGVATPINPAFMPYQANVTYNRGDGSAWFGPGKPMTPQAPPEVKGRAFDFPQSTNILTNSTPTQPIGFETLRAFADGYDLLRLLIESRKDSMERLRWVIQPRDATEKLSPQRRNRIKQLITFFQKPDGEHTWNTWLRMLLEDVFVIDAATLHRRKTGAGTLVSLDQVDGATMRRVLDDWGRTPEGPGEIAYQQILKGMPAVNYTSDEIFYRPRNPRIHKIYGYSPVQQIIMTISIALRRQTFQLNFFTEGNIPAALIGVPETWTPDQIRTFQNWFDGILAGNLAEKRKARFVPAAVGKTYVPTQETELFGRAEEWLARVCCYAFSIAPQPFVTQVNRATSETAHQVAVAEGMVPIQNYVKDLIDSCLMDDFHENDLEFVWKGDDELDPVKRQLITEGNLKVGQLTVNEGRVAQGYEPYDDPIYDKPMFMTSNGLAPLVLTSTAQGGPKLDEKGRPINATDGGLSPTVNPDGDTVVQPPTGGNDIKGTNLTKVQALIDAGDPVALANYLRDIQQGADA